MAALKKWWDSSTVAVVTGANKGIGYEIAKQLGRHGLSVVVTSRDEGRGEKAVKELQEAEPSAKFTYCQADITDQASIQKCAQTLKEDFGKVHVLVNNAGMAYKGNVFGAKEAQTTIACNLTGTRAMTEAVLPLMSQGARIVNVCSEAGHLRQLKSDELKAQFQNPSDADEVQRLADKFVEDIRAGTHAQNGWSNSMYGISKLAEVAYTMWLSRQLQPKGILVNAVCPGWCSTDMSSHSGPRTAESGADTPVWVALQPPGEAQSGQFYSDRTVIKW